MGSHGKFYFGQTFDFFEGMSPRSFKAIQGNADRDPSASDHVHCVSVVKPSVYTLAIPVLVFSHLFTHAVSKPGHIIPDRAGQVPRTVEGPSGV